MCRQCLFSLQKRRKTLKFGIILGKFVQCRFFLYFWVKNLRENLGKARPQFNDYFSDKHRFHKGKPLVLDEWDSSCWALFVDEAIVHKDKSITFNFNNGTNIKIEVLK